MICTAHQILKGDQMVHQVSWACGTNGEKEMDKKVLLRKSGGMRSLGRLTCN